MSFRRSLVALATALVATAHIAPAYAVDGDDVGRKLAAALAVHGVGFHTDKIVTNGDDVIFENAAIFNYALDGGPKFPIGTLKLQSIEAAADGGYRAAHGELAPFDIMLGDLTFKHSGVSIEDLEISGDPRANLAEALVFSAATGPLLVETYGRTMFSAKELLFNQVAKSGTLIAEAAIGDAVVHAEMVDGVGAALIRRALGQDDLQIKLLSASIQWDIDASTLDAPEILAVIDGVGTVGVRFVIGGYSPDFIRAHRDGDRAYLQKAYSSDVTFNSGQVFFNDDGGVQKILEYVAADGNVSADQYSDAYIARLRTLLAPLQPARSDKIAQAVETFLDKRGGLYFTANPSEPMTVEDIFMGIFMHPETLAEQLDFSAERYDR